LLSGVPFGVVTVTRPVVALYLSLANTFLLPHLGAATIETRTAMGMQALDNIDAVLGGRPAPSLVI
jgi:lactate dehydrogenase-like 2-hydroxyacid dehydrogenase